MPSSTCFQLFRIIEHEPRFVSLIRQVKSFFEPAGILPLLLYREGSHVKVYRS